MSENQNNSGTPKNNGALIPKPESDMMVPPAPLNPEDVSKVSGGKGDGSRSVESEGKKKESLWEKIKKPFTKNDKDGKKIR